ESFLDEIPVHFPALLEGLKLTKRAAKVGFDWENTDQIFDKIDEEIGELRAALKNGDKKNIDEEVGDLLFVVQNLARHLDVEPESALKRTNIKFRSRFSYIEKELVQAGKNIEDASIEEMDLLWNRSKAVLANKGS
ncbi:MAG: MazG nucleotide pyrophosphohydrolase domain-containing protein, partial [Pyrinomonadaceae bacterium]